MAYVCSKSGICRLVLQTRMKRNVFDIHLLIKLDHEVGLRRYWYQFRAEFRAGSFYDGPEAIRGQFRPKKTQNDFLKVAENFWVENWSRPGRIRIPAGQGSQTEGWGGQERAKEGQIRAI